MFGWVPRDASFSRIGTEVDDGSTRGLFGGASGEGVSDSTVGSGSFAFALEIRAEAREGMVLADAKMPEKRDVSPAKPSLGAESS